MGTFVEVEVAASIASERNAAIAAAFNAVARVQRLMSFHDRESDVSRLNREAGTRPTRVDPWTFRVLEAAIEMHRRSLGIFDVAVAPLLQKTGLLPRDSDDSSARPAVQLPGAIELLADNVVFFRSADTVIDLGGIAKGFAVDRAVEAMRSFDIEGGLVNASGDLRAFGQGTHTIHVRDPRDPSRLICQIDIANQALASTGRRFDPFESALTNDSAIIDPATRKPPTGFEGVTIQAPSCMIADGLTKVVMIAGTDAGALLKQYGAGALLVSCEGEILVSSDWHHVVHLAA